MVVVLIVVLFVLVLGAVLSPWRRGQEHAVPESDSRIQSAATEVLGLEAARDAKYREIRDAELDRETGHLSDADYQTVDTNLRAEAVEILKRLDRAQTRLAKVQASEPEDRALNASIADPSLPADLGESAEPAGTEVRAARSDRE